MTLSNPWFICQLKTDYRSLSQVLLSVSLHLIGCLDKSTAATAASHQGIIGGVTLHTIGLPGLAPQHHDGDAGRDAGQEGVQDPALPQVLCCGVDQAAAAPGGHAAWDVVWARYVVALLILTCSQVTAAVKSSIGPIFRHVVCCMIVLVLAYKAASSNSQNMYPIVQSLISRVMWLIVIPTIRVYLFMAPGHRDRVNVTRHVIIQYFQVSLVHIFFSYLTCM